MGMKRSTLVAALVLAGVGMGVGAFALLRPRPRLEREAGEVGTGSLRAGAVSSPGAQRRWKLTFDARLTERRSGGPEPVTMTMTGEWVVTTVAARADGYDVACEVVKPRVTGGGVPDVKSEEVAALERRMGQRFFVSYRADGAALQIHFPHAVDPGARNLLQLIVTDTQLVRPAAPATQWTAMEHDGTGTYLAAYHETAPHQLSKHKLKYVSVDVAPGGAKPGERAPVVEVAVDASARQLTLDDAGGILTFEGGDTMRIDLPMSDGAISMRVSARLSDVHSGRAPELIGALERERATLDTSGIVTHAPDPAEEEARKDRELVAGASLDGLLSGVRAKSDDTAVRAKLESWLRLHADASAPTTAAVRAAPAGPVTKALTEALGRAGTTSAQLALCALAREDGLPAPKRSDALVGLMLVKHPAVETTRAVMALLDVGDPVVRQAARFVAGTLARGVRQASPREGEALDRALANRYAAAKDVAPRVELLGAIGNSAGPLVFPAVRAGLGDRDATVRGAAMRALRLYEDDAARELLAGAITKDADATVRATAIFAAGFSETLEPFLDQLQKAAVQDASEFVRNDAVTLLARHRNDSPELTERIDPTLARVAAKDPKPGVRRLARAALDGAAR